MGGEGEDGKWFVGMGCAAKRRGLGYKDFRFLTSLRCVRNDRLGGRRKEKEESRGFVGSFTLTLALSHDGRGDKRVRRGGRRGGKDGFPRARE